MVSLYGEAKDLRYFSTINADYWDYSNFLITKTENKLFKS